MTFKGTFRDGVIVPEQTAGLRDGDVVDIRVRRLTATGKPRKKTRSRPVGKRMTAEQRLAAWRAVVGSWEDRPEWKGKSSAQIARDIRARAAARGARG